jgi:hypothetical protein
MIWVQNGLARAISRVDSAARANKMLFVPPGEAAHFVSAAQIDAAQRSRAPP